MHLILHVNATASLGIYLSSLVIFIYHYISVLYGLDGFSMIVVFCR